MIDYFILDKEKKTLRLYDVYREDGFEKCFENIEKIQMEKNSEKEKQTRVIIIETKDSELPISIEIDKDNNIIGYSNPQLTQVGDGFLEQNKQLSELNLPQLTQVGHYFIPCNEQLSKLNLPQLTQVGNGFLENLSAAVKQLVKIERGEGIKINLNAEKTSLQQRMEELSLKINKNNIFYKIKSFFKNLFYKDRKIENNVLIETISNDNIEKNENSKSAFIENIKIIEDENTLLLKRYIRGEIKKEDLTEEQRKSLYTLYHKQINNFKKSNEIRKNKLLQYKKELDL
ncbi:MAG: hypothetical protein HXK65_01760 [Clostridiales bacterium]|nr:hypothetical protein [Clostridiales bacterium]